MSSSSSNPSEVDCQLKKQIRAAAGVVTGSGNVVGVAKAMEVVGFSAEQRSNITLYQKVRRLAKKLAVVEAKGNNPTPPPSTVEMEPSTSATSSLTGSSRTNTEATPPTEEEPETPAGRARRSLALSISPVEDNVNDTNSSSEKKSRRTSKEVQRHNARVAALKS